MDALSFLGFAIGVFILMAAYPFQRVCSAWLQRLHDRSEELHRARVQAFNQHKSVIDMSSLVADVQASVRPRNRIKMANRHYTQLPGFVYLIRVNNEYCKIGMSQDVKTRLIELQVGSPYHLEVLHIIATHHASRLELYLQNRFAEHWVSGEWYGLDDDAIASIMSISSPVTLDDLARMGA